MLRGVSFDRHEISFIVVSKNDSDLCYRVQENDAKCHWMDLCKWDKLKSLDRLVIEKKSNSCQVVAILSKFEVNRGLIHVYCAGDNTLIFELPRFDLGFSLRLNEKKNYVITSNNYRDFHLNRL